MNPMFDSQSDQLHAIWRRVFVENVSRIYFSRKYLFLYNNIAKTGSKTLMNVISHIHFDLLSSEIILDSKTSNPDTYNDTGIFDYSQRFQRLWDNEQEEILKNYTFDDLLYDADIMRFTIVRNPFPRALSGYKLLERFPNFGSSNWTHKLSFLDTLKMIADQSEPERDKHLNSQCFVAQPRHIRYDFIGKLETLPLDIERLVSKIAPTLPESTKKRLTRTYDGLHATHATEKIEREIGEKEQDLICQIYQEDFETFGYGYDVDPVLFRSVRQYIDLGTSPPSPPSLDEKQAPSMNTAKFDTALRTHIQEQAFYLALDITDYLQKNLRESLHDSLHESPHDAPHDSLRESWSQHHERLRKITIKRTVKLIFALALTLTASALVFG